MARTKWKKPVVERSLKRFDNGEEERAAIILPGWQCVRRPVYGATCATIRAGPQQHALHAARCCCCSSATLRISSSQNGNGGAEPARDRRRESATRRRFPANPPSDSRRQYDLR